jgi:hypothetical protein
LNVGYKRHCGAKCSNKSSLRSEKISKSKKLHTKEQIAIITQKRTITNRLKYGEPKKRNILGDVFCKLCEDRFLSNNHLKSHLLPKHGLSAKQYYDKFFGNSFCPVCGKENQFEGLNRGYSKYCSHLCTNQVKREKLKIEREASYQCRCEICGEKSKDNGTLHYHVTRYHKDSITFQEYYDIYILEDKSRKICSCGSYCFKTKN